MLRFNSLLTAAGLEPAKIRLVRHKHKPFALRRVYQDAIQQHPRFEQFQAAQCNPTVIDQIRTAYAIAGFVVDPRGQTVFVGLWQVDGSREGILPDPYEPPPTEYSPGTVVFDLNRMAPLNHYCGRLVIDWGGGERAWVQYADRRDKEIIELRRTAEELPFPGFSRFMCCLNEIDALPVSWQEPLRASRGIYLLVHRPTGSQYVGSATGGEGFLGRWRGYADGHGGNVGLKELADSYTQYDVRILETAGSGISIDEIYVLESLWKEKLGSRVQGLNRN